jgi:hypothetical protein
LIHGFEPEFEAIDQRIAGRPGGLSGVASSEAEHLYK